MGETSIRVLPGQYYDAETGTNYNCYRDYDPTIGRYEQSDPKGLRGGVNTFAYVRSDPLDRFDSEGDIPIGAAAVRCLVGVLLGAGSEIAWEPIACCAKQPCWQQCDVTKCVYNKCRIILSAASGCIVGAAYPFPGWSWSLLIWFAEKNGLGYLAHQLEHSLCAHLPPIMGGTQAGAGPIRPQ